MQEDLIFMWGGPMSTSVEPLNANSTLIVRDGPHRLLGTSALIDQSGKILEEVFKQEVLPKKI